MKENEENANENISEDVGMEKKSEMTEKNETEVQENIVETENNVHDVKVEKNLRKADRKWMKTDNVADSGKLVHDRKRNGHTFSKKYFQLFPKVRHSNCK